MQEAQRYPEDFDGLVIGAPGLNLTGNVMRRIWVGQAQQGAAALPVEKLPLLRRLVYERCDRSDGLADGIIDDPRRCLFQPASDLPKCSGADGADCFTAAQIGGLSKIYGGVFAGNNRQLFPGEPVGSEEVWAENLVGPSKLVLPRAESQMKFYALDPPPGPEWSYTQFNFNRDPASLAKAAKIMNPLNEDLSALKKRGGKIIQYSGWADQQVNPLPGISYYDAVSRRMGDAATREFYRLFMVPGMYHCSGGPGCSSVDWLAALMDWVENGIAPKEIIGTHLEMGQPTRTRPLCPYPQVAKYQGAGSIDEAANFACANP
jgi:feruloyl esterase